MVKAEENIVNTFCAPHCMGFPCGFRVTVKDGKAMHLGMHPKTKYPPCPKGWTNISRLYHPDRLKYPMKRVGDRGEGKWERISWDEALDIIVSELNRVKAKYGNEAIVMYHYVGSHGLPIGSPGMRSTILRLFNLWGGCIPAYQRGSLCMQAHIEATTHLFGSRHFVFPPNPECELIIIWSTNPARTRVRGILQSFLDAKERGAKFVVIDPIFTATAATLADEYIPIRPGTDTALAFAMINSVIKDELYDIDTLLNHTNAPFLVRDDSGEFLRERDIVVGGSNNYMIWDTLTNKPRAFESSGIMPALRGTYAAGEITVKPVWQRIIEVVNEWTPKKAAAVTDIPAETIERLAKDFGTAKPAKVELISTPGLNRASWAENTVYALLSLNVITGNVVGDLPLLDPRIGGVDLGFQATLKKLEVENPVEKRIPVNHLAEAILNPSRYNTNIKALFVMVGNPVNQNANSNKTIRALMNLEFIAVSEIFMTATARYADILLPVNTLLERAAIAEGGEVACLDVPRLWHDTSIKRQLFFAEKAVDSLWESKSDFEITCRLAKKMGYGDFFPWKDEEEWIKQVLDMAKEDPRFPWLKPLTLDQLKREGIVDVAVPPPKPTWDLKTPSGRIELYSERLLKKGYDPIPVYREPEEGPVSTPELYKKYPLILVTPKPIWRAHSSFGNQPELLALYTPDVLIHSADALKRGIKDGDRVTVFNDRGTIQIKASVAENIKPGVVRIYEGNWPEHGMNNVLTHDRLTMYGENPTYNTCLVEVKKVAKED